MTLAEPSGNGNGFRMSWMKTFELHGIAYLSFAMKCMDVSRRRRRGRLASLAFQEPSTLTHPSAVWSPHPRFRRRDSFAFGMTLSLPAKSSAWARGRRAVMNKKAEYTAREERAALLVFSDKGGAVVRRSTQALYWPIGLLWVRRICGCEYESVSGFWNSRRWGAVLPNEW